VADRAVEKGTALRAWSRSVSTNALLVAFLFRLQIWATDEEASMGASC
jgi:hypothetical protein